jgi:DNA polymerase-3 subunit delta
VKANRAQLERALKAPAQTRFFLLYGPDDSGSRAFLAELARAVGPGSERVDLTGSELRSDPARLADESASNSLFGGARYIVVDPAGDESLAAVEALLQAPAAGNPVALVAGALKPASKLLKLALADPSALTFASYAPEGRDADRLVIELAQGHGLQVQPRVARRIADAAAGNRAVIAQELAKFALFLDCAPDRPRPLEDDVLDLVGAASEEGDLSRLVDSVAGGNPALLHSELLRLASEGIDGIVLVRAVLRRMMLLARLRSEVERGNSVSAVMAAQGKAIFWKEKDSVALQLSRWRSALIAKSMSRLLESERQVKAPGALGSIAVDEELFAICRQAARLRV